MTEDTAVVGVGGVGYEVFVGRAVAMQLRVIESTVTLEIHTHFSDSNLQLFGFLSLAEKALFRKLISVSGVGPKIGIAIISALPYETVIQAIVTGDLMTLTSISGIGKKTAERLVLDLKDKFKDMAARGLMHGIARQRTGADIRQADALQALVSLGYSELVARQTMQQIEVAPEDTVQALIKKSLGHLAS